MANANLILAIATGLRPPQISGAVANARSFVNNLLATDQLADEQALKALYAANLLQSPNGIDIVI